MKGSTRAAICFVGKPPVLVGKCAGILPNIFDTVRGRVAKVVVDAALLSPVLAVMPPRARAYMRSNTRHRNAPSGSPECRTRRHSA